MITVKQINVETSDAKKVFNNLNDLINSKSIHETSFKYDKNPNIAIGNIGLENERFVICPPYFPVLLNGSKYSIFVADGIISSKNEITIDFKLKPFSAFRLLLLTTLMLVLIFIAIGKTGHIAWMFSIVVGIEIVRFYAEFSSAKKAIIELIYRAEK